MESAFPEGGFPSESFWSALKNAHAPWRRTCPPCPRLPVCALQQPPSSQGAAPRCCPCPREGLGWASPGSRTFSVLPSCCWSELGDIPSLGFLGAGAGGLYPVAGGGGDYGGTRGIDRYFLHCQAADSGTSQDGNSSSCPAKCVGASQVRSTNAAFPSPQSIASASPGRVRTGWGRSPAPLRCGQWWPGWVDVRGSEGLSPPCSLLQAAPSGSSPHAEVPRPPGMPQSRGTTVPAPQLSQLRWELEASSLLVSWTGGRNSLTLAKDTADYALRRQGWVAVRCAHLAGPHLAPQVMRLEAASHPAQKKAAF